jgi:Tol biopolymer transport system component
MNEKEKRKNTPRRLTFILLPLVLTALSALLTYLFLKNANNAPDIIFLHTEADGFTQIYGLNLDGENLATNQAVALTQPDAQLSYITGYAIHGDWLIYAQSEDPMRLPEPIQNELILLNWRSSEKRIVLDCDAIGLNCIDSILHFSNDGGTIFLHDTITYPPTVWMLDTEGSEPQIFAQHEGIAEIQWIADNAFLYHYRDDEHNSHDMLYNIDTQSSIDLSDLIYDEQLGRIIGISPDNQVIFFYINEFTAESRGMEGPSILLFKLSTKSEEIYRIPESNLPFVGDYNSLVPLYWYPDQSAFLYDSPSGSLSRFVLASETIEAVWSSDELIKDIRWNGDGSQFVFVRGAGWESQGELWLYDMETQEALPLPVLGYMPHWIEGEQ